MRSDPAIDAAIPDLLTPGAGKGPDASYSYALDVIQRAERYGFDTTLVAERLLGPDLEAWLLATAIAAHTSRIEIITAVHPGIFAPQLTAKLAATLDRISGGRAAVNIVNGWWKEEFEFFSNGATLDADNHRYQRMGEFMQILRQLWTDENVTFEGDFYSVKDATIPTKPRRRPHPPIYAASGAEAGQEAIARDGDVWFIGDDPRKFQTFEGYVEQLRVQVDRMRVLSGAHGRDVACGISANVILSPTKEHADRQMAAAAEFSKRGMIEMISAGGLAAGLVGTPEFVAERLGKLEDAGLSLVLMKFFPAMDQLDQFGQEVMPLLARSSKRAAA